MNPSKFPELGSVNDAVHYALQAVDGCGSEVPPTTDPTSIGSMFGHRLRSTREVIGVGFSITNPMDRLLPPTAKSYNPAYAVANLLWTMSGEDTPERIAFYTRSASRFLDRSGKFSAAPGQHIFKGDDTSRRQIERVVDLLRQDRSSRRAVLPLLTEQYFETRPKDTPCTVALQFFIRNDKLLTVTFMRSQSALMILPYDLFLFTSIQELVASELQIEPGNYTHICSSLHYYEDENELVREFTSEQPVEASIAFRPMPAGSLTSLDHILDVEREIRTRVTHGEPITWYRYDLDYYWLELITFAVASARRRAGDDVRFGADVSFSKPLLGYIEEIR